MRCIMCDKCNEIIGDPKQVRIITCSRPMKRPAGQESAKREFTPPTQDIIWDKELCVKCAMEIETPINGDNAEEETE